jgi:mono/diheme cytochrome c family protein
VLTGSLTSCEWFTDFKQQPSVNAWQPFTTDSAELKGFRGQPVNSVPTHGAMVPGYAISYSPMPATVDSFSTLANPVSPDARSLANGRIYYSINCAVCHGDAGDGNGTMKALSPMYGFAPSLLTDQAKSRTDGYLWGMIRNGRGLMASYNRIEELDRWDVVNYVRGLQGKLTTTVPVGAVGRPGEAGAKLPGPTRIAPTIPTKWRAAGAAARTAGPTPAASPEHRP